MILESILDNQYPYATFHDSILYNIDVDYKDRVAKFKIDMLVGDPSEKDIDKREAYAIGILTFINFIFCTIDPPDPSYNFIDTEGLWIDEGPITNLKGKSLPNDLLEKIPADAIARYFFIADWNSFIYVVSESVEFSWAK